MNQLHECKIEMTEVKKIAFEVLKVEKETTQKMNELVEFKKSELAKLWSGDCSYETKLKEVA